MAIIKNKNTSTGTAKRKIPRAKREEQLRHGRLMKQVKDRMHHAANAGKLARDNDIDTELNQLRENIDEADDFSDGLTDTELQVPEPKELEPEDAVIVFDNLRTNSSGNNSVSNAVKLNSSIILAQERRHQYIMPTPVTRGVVFLGRIPHGFYEDEMRNYFTQFGEITRVRLSRNKKTGKSKHYAFIEFSDPSVADIVASTMNGYIMFGQVLVCKRIAHDQVHPELFKGANRTFRVVNLAAKEMAIVNRPKSRETVIKHVKQLISLERSRASKLKALGIDYDSSQVSFETLAKQANLVLNGKGVMFSSSSSDNVLGSSIDNDDLASVSESRVTNESSDDLVSDSCTTNRVTTPNDDMAEQPIVSNTIAAMPISKNKRPLAALDSSLVTKSTKKSRTPKKSSN